MGRAGNGTVPSPFCKDLSVASHVSHPFQADRSEPTKPAFEAARRSRTYLVIRCHQSREKGTVLGCLGALSSQSRVTFIPCCPKLCGFPDTKVTVGTHNVGLFSEKVPGLAELISPGTSCPNPGPESPRLRGPGMVGESKTHQWCWRKL